jgi:hypothetical protein
MNAVAGGSMTVTVQITDSAHNNVSQAGTTITLTPPGTTANTSTAGLATFSISFNTAGTYQLTATAASLSSAQSNAFVIAAGAHLR